MDRGWTLVQSWWWSVWPFWNSCGEENEATNAAILQPNEPSLTLAVSHWNLSKIQGITPLKQYRQSEHWDCGVACLNMIFDWLMIQNTVNIQLNTRSVWTVDLVQILHHHIILMEDSNYLFCSLALQVNESLATMFYYQAAFEGDKQRVSDIFQRIHDEQWPALQIDLSLLQVVELVSSENCVAIALVDNTILTEQQQQPQQPRSYMGHYIVVTGVENEDWLVVQNPGMDDPKQLVSLEHFERAWRAPGTDQDIIFVVRST